MIDHPSIPGIHHVTAIASGAQTNYNFYTDVLGRTRKTYREF